MVYLHLSRTPAAGESASVSEPIDRSNDLLVAMAVSLGLIQILTFHIVLSLLHVYPPPLADEANADPAFGWEAHSFPGFVEQLTSR